MKFQYINEIIPLLKTFVQKFGGEVVPCTSEEVNHLELMLPNSYLLPTAFKEFLLYGGNKLGKLFEGEHSPSYCYSLGRAENSRGIVASKIYGSGSKTAELSDDLFVVSSHITSYVAYFRLTEGENPPVYSWSDEDELGIEAVQKEHNTFTDFIREEIRIRTCELRPSVKEEEINLGKFPRGRQFWLARRTEENHGVVQSALARYLGVGPLWKLEQITDICNITPIEYLEELSGWKAHKVGDEIRFFPPSYESPEEKEKKALEQQNQLESKKQELAEVEKIIAHLTNRIKNLSGGKLTAGISFSNASALKANELKQNLRKQKTLKQRLEKAIAKLEEKSN